MEIIKNPNFDFLGKTRFFVTLSILFIAGGVATMLTRGINSGVEFSGGTQIVAQFRSAPQIDRIREAIDKVAPGSVIQTYGEAAGRKVLIRSGEERAGQAREEELDALARTVLKSLSENYSQNPVTESSSEIVGPIVGAELRQKAIQLTVLGLLFQLLYIWWRFRGFVWGTAAALAAFHDVLICVGFLAFFNYEITLNVIAALLTLVGYSVNDTIVIFDRARENLRQRRKEPLVKVLNDSVNQTLTRTVISSGTTFLSVLGLWLLGGDVLRAFGFTMVVGILVGTYSTVFIAIPLVVWWSGMAQRRKASTAKAAL
jgi:preprotein translocase subunit SecF